MVTDDWGGTTATGIWWSDNTACLRTAAITVTLEPTKEELKAIAREKQREQSLDACQCLSWAHHVETPPTDGAPLYSWHRRPTQRRTATAVRNFRRAH